MEVEPHQRHLLQSCRCHSSRTRRAESVPRGGLQGRLEAENGERGRSAVDGRVGPVGVGDAGRPLAVDDLLVGSEPLHLEASTIRALGQTAGSLVADG